MLSRIKNSIPAYFAVLCLLTVQPANATGQQQASAREEHTIKLTPTEASQERVARIVAPGNGLHHYNLYSIDTTAFPQGGDLIIDSQIAANSRTGGAFDVYPADGAVPVQGPTNGSLASAYHIRPGAGARIIYHFAFGEVLKFGLEGNWSDPQGATGEVRFKVKVIP